MREKGTKEGMAGILGMEKGFKVRGSMCKAWARTEDTVGKRGIGRTSLRNLLRRLNVRFLRKVVIVVRIEVDIRKVVCGLSEGD